MIPLDADAEETSKQTNRGGDMMYQVIPAN